MQKKNTASAPKVKKPSRLLRGMKDILPENQRYWYLIKQKVEKIASIYSFGRIDTPMLEETSLFTRSIGKETDIIEKEMYTFEDKGGDSISLRPDGTAGVVRAYIEHGMLNRPQPVKMFYYGPFFRYDRPQSGRYRQFWQFGFEVIGDDHPVLDAQLIMMAHNLYVEIGLPVSMQVNSVGCKDCREEYQKVLIDYYKSRKNTLCEVCKKRLLKNPLRLLDCKEEDCQLLVHEAPQIVDYLCEDCNLHFVKVLENLDAIEIPYVLNSRLVRGLDYYSRTAFEIWPEVVTEVTNENPDNLEENDNLNIKKVKPQKKSGAQSALGGGGRYDSLTEMMGGQPTPGIGFACGIERLIIELKKRDIKVPRKNKPDIFVAQLGDEARKKSFRLFDDLRKEKFRIIESFSKDGLKSQMELANKNGVKFTVIIGQKEILDDTILIRNMESGIQETVTFEKIIPELRKRLEKLELKNKSTSK